MTTSVQAVKADKGMTEQGPTPLPIQPQRRKSAGSQKNVSLPNAMRDILWPPACLDPAADFDEAELEFEGMDMFLNKTHAEIDKEKGVLGLDVLE